jgi:outer membrane protein assembly factor BamA
MKILYYPEDDGGNISTEEKPKIKKSGTSADKVTPEAELQRQVKELSDKLAEREKTDKDNEELKVMRKQIDTISGSINSSASEKPSFDFKSVLADLSEFLGLEG